VVGAVERGARVEGDEAGAAVGELEAAAEALAVRFADDVAVGELEGPFPEAGALVVVGEVAAADEEPSVEVGVGLPMEVEALEAPTRVLEQLGQLAAEPVAG
jgi:hypothetical protein